MTVTVKDPVAVLPAASVAENVTVVAPSGKVEPDECDVTTVIGAVTRSVAVGIV